MKTSNSIVAAALAGMGLLAVGRVSISTESNAGVAPIVPAERIEGAFDLLVGDDLLAGPKRSEVRTIAIGYQTDTTAALLIRKPGQLTPDP